MLSDDGEHAVATATDAVPVGIPSVGARTRDTPETVWDERLVTFPVTVIPCPVGTLWVEHPEDGHAVKDVTSAGVESPTTVAVEQLTHVMVLVLVTALLIVVVPRFTVVVVGEGFTTWSEVTTFDGVG
jgi:hypothetical protein